MNANSLRRQAGNFGRRDQNYGSRRAIFVAAAGITASFLAVQPVLAQSAVTVMPSNMPVLDAHAAQAHLFDQFYRTGMARLGMGNSAGAQRIFAMAAEIAPDLPQMRYALSIAQILSDFSQRESALPQLRAVVANDPNQPLYSVAAVLADPDLSVLKADGALYLTPEGGAQIARASDRLRGDGQADNAKFLALWLGALEPTGDPALPQRLANFAGMVEPGSNVTLPEFEAKVAFGQLMMLSIPQSTLKPYEARFVDRLVGGGNVGLAKQHTEPERRSDLEAPIAERIAHANAA